MKVNNETVLTGEVYFPGYSEQKKIVGFLTILDERIRQQRNLVEALKKYKRGLLSNLFGEKITQGCTTKSYYFSEIAQRRSEKYDPTSGIEYPCVELENIEQETGKILSTVPSTAQSSIKNIAKSGDTLFGKLRLFFVNMLLLKRRWLAHRRFGRLFRQMPFYRNSYSTSFKLSNFFELPTSAQVQRCREQNGLILKKLSSLSLILLFSVK